MSLKVRASRGSGMYIMGSFDVVLLAVPRNGWDPTIGCDSNLTQIAFFVLPWLRKDLVQSHCQYRSPQVIFSRIIPEPVDHWGVIARHFVSNKAL